MTRSERSGTGAVWITLAAILAVYLALGASRLFPSQHGIDLYHPWGVHQAYDVLARSPYTDTAGFGQWLSEASKASDSAKLKAANQFWEKRRGPTLEPTGTPFFYAVASILPHDFDEAQKLVALLQYLATGLAVFMLARLRGAGVGPAVVCAIFVEVTFNPFVQDVGSGNVNSLQLLLVVALIWLASRNFALDSGIVDFVYLGALALAIVWKPNIGLIATALALHHWLVRGSRGFFRGAAFAAVVAGVAFGFSAWYFGDVRIWLDWVSYTQGASGGTLFYSVDLGNQSLPMMLAQRSGALGPLGYSFIISGIAVGAMWIAMSASGRKQALVKPLAIRLLSDPWFAAGAGVLLTFATSPLMWIHYHLFALVPIAFLFGRDGAWGVCSWTAAISYFLESTPWLGFLIGEGRFALAHSLSFFFWTPLVAGMLLYVVRQRRALESTR